MTTFTLQELNLPTTQEEAIKALEQVTKEKWMEYGMNHPISANLMNEEVLNGITQILNDPTPQPTLCESTQTDLPSIINNICAQLQLLATVITQHQANTTPPEGDQSLQETVSLTLQQAGWFEDMVRDMVHDMEFDDAIKDRVETEVEHYFAYSFDPTDHFDIDDAVTNAVDDKIDQAVENYMDNATLTIERK